MTNDTLEQDICSSCRVVKGVRYFAREDVWHCEDCQAYDLDTVEMIECPNHEGAYDCTPFCSICEGEQEYVASQVADCSVCGDELDQETGYHILNNQIICSQCIESEK